MESSLEERMKRKGENTCHVKQLDGCPEVSFRTAEREVCPEVLNLVGHHLLYSFAHIHKLLAFLCGNDHCLVWGAKFKQQGGAEKEGAGDMKQLEVYIGVYILLA